MELRLVFSAFLAAFFVSHLLVAGCTAPCEENDDCEAGFCGDDGACAVDACDADGDCEGGNVCNRHDAEANRCEAPAIRGEFCFGGGDAVPSQRSEKTCAEGLECVRQADAANAFGTCVPASNRGAGEPCNLNDQCEEGLSCGGDVNFSRCALPVDAPCTEDAACASEVCSPTTSLCVENICFLNRRDCPQDQVCGGDPCTGFICGTPAALGEACRDPDPVCEHFITCESGLGCNADNVCAVR